MARKLSGEIDARSPLMDNAIGDAITLAERIMRKIDQRFATPPDQHMTSNADYPWKSRT